MQLTPENSIGRQAKVADPVEILLSEFERRKSRNTRYSLRAFAKAAGISSGRLSEILSRKRAITPASAVKIAENIDLPPAKHRMFLESIAKTKSKGLLAPSPAKPWTPISEDVFASIADWYHYAILGIMKLDKYSDDPKWLSKKLGISPVQVRSALERLVRLGMIENTSSGHRRIVGPLTTTHDVPSKALRISHRQRLKMAAEALEGIDPAQRDFTGMTIAMDASRMQEAKILLREFRRKFAQTMEDGPRNAVFNLNIQLLPVTL